MKNINEVLELISKNNEINSLKAMKQSIEKKQSDYFFHIQIGQLTLPIDREVVIDAIDKYISTIEFNEIKEAVKEEINITLTNCHIVNSDDKKSILLKNTTGHIVKVNNNSLELETGRTDSGVTIFGGCMYNGLSCGKSRYTEDDFNSKQSSLNSMYKEIADLLTSINHPGLSIHDTFKVIDIKSRYQRFNNGITKITLDDLIYNTFYIVRHVHTEKGLDIKSIEKVTDNNIEYRWD